MFFINDNDQQTKTFKGVCEVSNGVHSQLPSVAGLIGKCFDLIQRLDVFRESDRRGEHQ